MDIIKNIIADYEQLIKTNIKIPLSNGDTINFTFQPQDLPHLLGLQYLVDNPVLFSYSQKQLSATDLYNRMCSEGEDGIDTDEFEKSIYFDELYENRIKYFSSALLLDIIQARQIVKFDPSKIKNFSTKLEKIEYMFWKCYKDENNNYGYFGIGFMASGKENDRNYPNTFFFRLDNEYICDQRIVYPYSFMMKNKYGVRMFKIYWEEVEKGLHKNVHFKKLKKYLLEDESLDVAAIQKCSDADICKHYDLLQLDALNVIYLPYMDEKFLWTNDEKRFVLQKMKKKNKDFLPGEVKNLLNEYRQKRK